MEVYWLRLFAVQSSVHPNADWQANTKITSIMAVNRFMLQIAYINFNVLHIGTK